MTSLGQMRKMDLEGEKVRPYTFHTSNVASAEKKVQPVQSPREIQYSHSYPDPSRIKYFEKNKQGGFDVVV